MKIPVIQGVIDRRILVNFQVDPEVLSLVLPPPFLPKLAGDRGMAGVCLIRLKEIRPRRRGAARSAGSNDWPSRPERGPLNPISTGTAEARDRD